MSGDMKNIYEEMLYIQKLLINDATTTPELALFNPSTESVLENRFKDLEKKLVGIIDDINGIN